MRDQLRAQVLAAFIVLLSISPAAAPAQTSPASGITTEETQPPFLLRAERNLVLVRVVVRDKHGRFVGDLKQQNVELFDNRKPQTITHFSIEHPATASAAAPIPDGNETAPPARADRAKSPEAPPQRFLALLFDDVHASQGDLNQVSAAAVQYLATALHPDERVGVFTTSGHGELDFTNDLDAAQIALKKLVARPVAGPKPCPPISGYEAWLIVYMGDPAAQKIAAANLTGECMTVPEGAIGSVMSRHIGSYIQAKAQQVLSESEVDARHTFNQFNRVVERLSERPGERTLVLVSPGFFDRTVDYALDPILDSALRQGIVVSALSTLGLPVPPVFGADNKRIPLGGNIADAVRIWTDNVITNEEPLLTLVDGTGGTFFHNNNDFLAGFRATAEPPEVYYLLAFTPVELKFDGKFHKLQVKLAEAQGLSVQARRGYFAPKEGTTEAQQVAVEIRQAMYALAESRTIPVEIYTQFFKSANSSARLTVVVQVDPRALQFRKEEAGNLDEITLTTVLFDNSGKFIAGKQKSVRMHLDSTALAQLLKSPQALRTRFEFDLAPGTYRVREIVRDSNSARMSAVNHLVQIP